MTWDAQRRAFICTRNNPPCRGTGNAVIVKPADEYHEERIECPVCGRVNQPTYETADGRTVLLAHS